MAYSGIIIAMVIVFILLVLDERMEKDSKLAKTVDLCDGLVHITIPSFEEWCESDVSISKPVLETKTSTDNSAETKVSTETNETNVPETNETDLFSILVAYGITKQRASILIDALGENILNIAKERGVKELTKIKGIGDVTAAKVVALANTY